MLVLRARHPFANGQGIALAVEFAGQARGAAPSCTSTVSRCIAAARIHWGVSPRRSSVLKENSIVFMVALSVKSLKALAPDVPIRHATRGNRAKNGIGGTSGRPDKDEEDTHAPCNRAKTGVV